MARLQSKSLAAPDEVRRTPDGRGGLHHPPAGVCPPAGPGIPREAGPPPGVGPGSVFDIPPGHDGWVIGDEPWVTYDVAGMRSFARVGEGPPPVPAAALFTDIVASAPAAERLGAERWRETVALHNERIQQELDRFRGRLIKTTGDGVLALFDGSERAVRAAAAICLAAKALGLAIPAGGHTGGGELRAGR